MKTMSATVAAVILSAVASAADLPLALRDFVAGPTAHVRIVNTAGQAITFHLRSALTGLS